ncbi:MAG: hypothetical protein LBK07_03445 [Tannerella sp.]|jgi:hypothetical protein|nr:hypothetical protein [Tannerella sp.]
MKTVYSLLLLPAILLGFSCTDKYTEELTVNSPVYMSYDDLRSAVASAPARPLVRPGKIYFKGRHLFVVEYMKGVHVIDVSNPSRPQNTGFIEIPGCADIAVKDQSLYADSFVDLVTIDISDAANPKVTQRLSNTFSYTVPEAEDPQYPYAEVNRGKGVVVGWEIKRVTRELVNGTTWSPGDSYHGESLKWYSMSSSSASYQVANSDGGSAAASFGKSGSMARFGLYGKFLYIADNSMLYLFDTETPSSPVRTNTQSLSGGIETMFIYDGHMFFGTPTGMVVYSLEVPASPSFIANFWHVTSCDPVVVQDGYAYITLRSGTNCGGNTNQLDVVKISEDYKEYTLVNSYSMVNPHGLGIDGERLFVCDGEAGLKVYDAKDREFTARNMLASFPDIQAYDVIPADGYLFMVGSDGFYLYDYSDPTAIRQVGHIPVEKQ